jgi:hypothetical protein
VTDQDTQTSTPTGPDALARALATHFTSPLHRPTAEDFMPTAVGLADLVGPGPYFTRSFRFAGTAHYGLVINGALVQIDLHPGVGGDRTQVASVLGRFDDPDSPMTAGGPEVIQLINDRAQLVAAVNATLKLLDRDPENTDDPRAQLVDVKTLLSSLTVGIGGSR